MVNGNITWCILFLVLNLIIKKATCDRELSVVPLKYKLHYTFGDDENLSGYNGSVSIELRATDDLKLLHFDYFGSVTGIKIQNLNKSIEVTNFNYVSIGELGQQRYRVESTDYMLHKGQHYQIALNFTGIDYNYHIGLERKFYKTQNGLTSPIVYTDFGQFNLIFPRFRNIPLEFNYELSITHNRVLTAVSNMPALRTAINEELVMTKFQETPPIALHSFGFTVGLFATTKIDNRRNFSISIYGSPLSIESIYIFPEFVGQIFTEYEKYLGQEISISKLDFVVIPELSSTSITNYGLVLCRDTTIDYGRNSLKPMLLIPTAGKAIGDHFFMDLFGSVGSQFHWAKDGISSYLTVKMLENIEPYTENLYKMISYHKSFEIEHTLDSVKLSNVHGRRDVRYTKSAALFRMINRILGEEKFKTILSESLRTGINFIQLFAASFRNQPNFNEFVASWINEKGYPIVMVNRNYTSGEIIMVQKPYGWSELDAETTWWIPYNFASKSKPNFDNTKPDGWMSERNKQIVLNISATDWIIGNKLSTGYYLVNYDEHNWNLIIEELTNGDMSKIHAVNRDNLLTTAYLLSTSKEMSDTMFFNLFLYLKREIHPRPWFVANEILDQIVARDLTREYNTRLNEVIYTIFGALYDNYNGEPSLNYELFEVTRVIAMKWACYAGHVKCINDFEKLSNFYIQLIEYNQSTFMDIEIRNMMLCYGFQKELDYIRLYTNYTSAGYDEMIKNRIDCHLHTNMFRSKFISHFIFKQIESIANMEEDKIQLFLIPKFQNAIPDLIFEVFELNFAEFEHVWKIFQTSNMSLLPFETINEMFQQFEKYSVPQGHGIIDRDRLNRMKIKIQTTFGQAAADVLMNNIE